MWASDARRWVMDRDRALAVRLSKLAEDGNSGE
jgi:hypothetical protein